MSDQVLAVETPAVETRPASSFATFAARAMTFLRGIGPYAAIELVLPGGTLIALLIWLYRNRQCPGHHA